MYKFQGLRLEILKTAGFFDFDADNTLISLEKNFREGGCWRCPAGVGLRCLNFGYFGCGENL